MRRRDYGYFRDECASVTIFAVVTFAFLMAFTGLVFDVGRIFNLHSQAQAYADEVALAAAAELDGESGSIQRAIRAVVGDGQRDSMIDSGFRLTLSGDNAVNIESLTFLSALAADPADPDTRQPLAGDTKLCTWTGGTSDCIADDDAQAAFVLATTSIETEDFHLFPIAGAFVPNMIDQASVQPQALAGFIREVCNIPPMAICNPDEDPGGGGGFTARPGQQILLQAQGGGGATWTPGNFGFLDLTGLGENECSGGGANYLRCILGLVNPNTQCLSADVDFSPGNTNSADVGINVRFDIYDTPLQTEFNNPSFASDENVIKGALFTNCKTTPKNSDDPQTVPLPNDIDISVDNRIGDGVTLEQLDDYWAANHNGAVRPAEVTTRYEAYQYEIANTIPDESATLGEDGNPTCSSSPLADRRRIVVAAVNCIEHGVINGNESGIPVTTFIEMFITNYVNPDDHNIYAEVISVVEPGSDDGVLHEFPVLYR
ncbi:MAG: hypothetical protein KAJ29_05110 [Alphaproteobacteria bacterium]|nr:hypothetical protein [Alphaproteobacteria bacterium]